MAEVSLKNKYLKNTKVILKPTPRSGGIIKDKDHKMFFMMEEAISEWKLPLSRKNGQLVNPFESKEEQEFFEKEIGTDLSIYKKENNFWWDFKVQVVKTPKLLDEGMVFDLSDPIQALKVKVLRLQSDIAPSWELRKKRPQYRWVLVDNNQTIIESSSKADIIAEAYANYNKIKNSESKMREMLEVYGATKGLTSIVPKDVKKEFLKTELFNIIQKNPEGYVEIINDKYFDMKLLVNAGVRCGAIERFGNKYTLPGGDPISPMNPNYESTVKELVAWSDGKNDNYEKFMVLKARIENAK